MENKQRKPWKRVVAFISAMVLLITMIPFNITVHAADGPTLIIIGVSEGDEINLSSTKPSEEVSVTANVEDSSATYSYSYEWESLDVGVAIITLEESGTAIIQSSNTVGSCDVTVKVTATPEDTTTDNAILEKEIKLKVKVTKKVEFAAEIKPADGARIGDILTLSVASEDADYNTINSDLDYQWKKDGEDIDNATSVTYEATVEGNYSAKVSYAGNTTETGGYFEPAEVLATVISVGKKQTVVKDPTLPDPSNIEYGTNCNATISANVAGKFVVGSNEYSTTAKDEEFVATIPLDTQSAGSKSIAYLFTPDDSDYEAVSGNTSYTVKPKELEFEITVADKYFDNTTAVKKIGKIELSNNSSLIASDTGECSVTLTAGQLEFSNTGNVDQNTNVAVKLGEGEVVPVTIDEVENSNYSAKLTFNTPTIKFNEVDLNSYTVATPNYTSDEKMGWYSGTTVPVKKTEGYLIATEIGGTYQDTIGCTPNEGNIVFYVKKEADQTIAKATETNKKTDSMGPSIGISDVSQNITFTKTNYTISVTDAGSGVDNDTVQYCIGESDTLNGSETWTSVSLLESEEYAFTVAVPNSGYLYVQAKDNVGNSTKSSAMQALVLEKDEPTISLSGVEDTFKKAHTITVHTSDADADGNSPYGYSGIANISYQIKDSNNAVVKEETSMVSNTMPVTMSEIPKNREKDTSIEVNGLDGTYTVEVTVRDFCGNTKTETVEVKLDNTAPTVKLAMDTPVTVNNDGKYYYKSDNGEIKVEVEDSNSLKNGTYEVTVGTQKKDIEVDGNKGNITFSAAEIAILGDGEKTITVNVTDAAGNVADVIVAEAGVTVQANTASFVLDTTVPVVTGITTTEVAKGLYNSTDYYYNESSINTTFAITETNVEKWNISWKMNENEFSKEFSGNTPCISFEEEGKYSQIQISGVDKAGNELKLDTGFADAINASSDDGNGNIIISNSKIIDRTAPIARITYQAIDEAYLYDEDDNGTKETVYYNTGAQAEIEFTDTTWDLDDTKLFVGKTGEEASHPTDGSLSSQFTEEGTYKLNVYGTDRAGNAVTVVEESLNSEANVTTEDCTISYDAKYQIIVDKTNPVVTFEITPNTNVINKELQVAGESQRYFFNDGYTAKATVTEEYFNSELIQLERASKNSGSYNSATENVVFDATTSQVTSTSKTYEETLDKADNGVYQYRVYGTDKAGNALRKNGSIQDDLIGTTTISNGALDVSALMSNYIVIDSIAPVGYMSVSAETTDNANCYYKKTTDNTVTVANPYRSEDYANIFLGVDTIIENSPVKIDYVSSAQLATETIYTDTEVKGTEYLYDNLVTRNVKGEQIFYVKDYIITDYAGNTSATGFVSNKIYLDVNAPEIDELAPNISVVARTNSDAYGPNNNPLYDTDVPFDITIEDINIGKVSSGLNEIVYELYVNGTLTDTQTLLNTNDSSLDPSNPVDEDEFIYKKTCDITVSKTHNSNDIKVVITALDRAKNKNIAEYSFGIDTTAPIIEIIYDNNTAENEMYFKEERNATISVTERNFAADKIKISTEGSQGSWQRTAGTLSNGDDDVWKLVVTYAQDGEYTLGVSGSDLLNHSATDIQYKGTAPQKFVIDKTKPVIEVTYNTNQALNGKYYNVDRIADIYVKDENFEGKNDIVVTATEGGIAPAVSFIEKNARMNFSQDGVYSFEGTVTDLAGNISDSVVGEEFVIDQTNPEISIFGVEEFSANRNPIDAILSMTDKNLDLEGIQADLTGTNNGAIDISGKRSYVDEGVQYVLDTINVDDYYQLIFNGTDLAGNSTEKMVSFSENQNGTVFELVQAEIRNQYINTPVTPAVIIHNVDEVTILSVTLNGKEVDYTYADNKVTLKDQINTDGKYTLTMDTLDAAGNANTMDAVEFYMDLTAPTLNIIGAKDGEYYFETFDISLQKDNAEDTYQILTLNGENLTEDDYIVQEDGTYIIKIDEFKEYELIAQLVDKAGNTSELYQLDFILTDNIFIRWYANKVLFYTSLAAITLMAAGGSLLIFKKRGNKN